MNNTPADVCCLVPEGTLKLQLARTLVQNQVDKVLGVCGVSFIVHLQLPKGPVRFDSLTAMVYAEEANLAYGHFTLDRIHGPSFDLARVPRNHGPRFLHGPCFLYHVACEFGPTGRPPWLEDVRNHRRIQQGIKATHPQPRLSYVVLGYDAMPFTSDRGMILQ